MERLLESCHSKLRNQSILHVVDKTVIVEKCKEKKMDITIKLTPGKTLNLLLFPCGLDIWRHSRFQQGHSDLQLRWIWFTG